MTILQIASRSLQRGAFGDWLKAKAFSKKSKPKLKATPEQLRALQKKHGKG